MSSDTDKSDQPLRSKSLRFDHPLFLHPSDAHATTLVFAVLVGFENYPTWSRAMKIALLGRNKLGFVDGTCTCEQQDPDLHQIWDRCNAVVLSWLLHSVNKSISGGIAFSDSAKRVWTELKERFDKSDNTRIFGLHKSINTLTQGTLSVSSYYSRLKYLWDEIDSLVLLPSCQCTTSQAYTKIVQEQRLFQFLMGLDDSYYQARSHVLLLSPLPPVNQAFSLISQHEAQRTLSTPSSAPSQPESEVKFVRGGRGGRGRGRGGGTGRGNYIDECSHCHRKGHKHEKCFHLIGFPPN